MTFAMASWGGVQFFIIPIGLFILALPFVRKDHKFLLWSIPLFVGSFLLTALMFERPGSKFCIWFRRNFINNSYNIFSTLYIYSKNK